jgi:hypothetical protein
MGFMAWEVVKKVGRPCGSKNCHGKGKNKNKNKNKKSTNITWQLPEGTIKLSKFKKSAFVPNDPDNKNKNKNKNSINLREFKTSAYTPILTGNTKLSPEFKTSCYNSILAGKIELARAPKRGMSK